MESNKPLLCIFIDGLRPDSIANLPFLSSFAFRKSIGSEHGYSIACHGTMYSGVRVDRHKLWFVWQFSPETSPFRRFAKISRLFFANWLPVKLLIHKAAVIFGEKNTSFFGIPRFVHVPMKFLKFLDVTEKVNYCEPGYINDVPSVFDILRENNIEFDITGMDKSAKEESEILEKRICFQKAPFIYWFLGDVDHFSHEFGQTSPEGKKRLLALDRLLEKKYRELVDQIGNVEVLIWSDHGHIDVEEKIDPYHWFEKNNLHLDKFNHVVDGTYLRFWFDSDSDKESVLQVLNKARDYGLVFSESLLRKYRLDVGDRRYGDVIFALNPGRVFSKTIWGWSRGLKSMHGYDPDDPRSDGVVISSLPLKEKPHLVDVTPSILTYLGQKVPAYMEGSSFFGCSD